ncbi:Glutathione synthetase chloroplastic [Zea mays]|uniref:Glutathione synthetase chloroplastic n=1 Tax=Zea mays TaxID=4577 RepID=A0A1D6P4Y7_MAIZE|nr:Glutathione synthetase chloroplastic [Zea mays]
MMLINNKEDIRLILHQSDYMLDSETNSLLQIENSRSYYFAINAATFCCSIRISNARICMDSVSCSPTDAYVSIQ